jgi:hypothetical protein
VALPQQAFAFDAIRIDTTPAEDSGAPTPQGLDLDGHCNCVEAPSCIRLSDAGPSICSDGGRDDVTGTLLASLGSLTGVTPAVLQTRLRQGVFSVLVVLTGWNGTDDDPVVTAMVMTSPGINVPEGGTRIPAFDGSDVWDVDPAAVVDGALHNGEDCAAIHCVSLPSALDFEAYVAGGMLVAHFAKIPLAIVAARGTLTLPFVGATLLAKISKDDAGLYHLVGELAGRLPANDLLLTSSTLTNPLDKTPICPGTDSYNLFKQGICAGADLQADPSLDDGKHPCDALSEAVSFSALTAHLGVLRTVVQADPVCPPINDSCTP